MAEAAVRKEQQKEDHGTNELIEQQLQDLDNVDAEEVWIRGRTVLSIVGSIGVRIFGFGALKTR